MDYSWNWITEYIALGGEMTSEQDVAELKAAGIIRVINCREICDPLYSEDALVTCWPKPRHADDGTPRTAQWFREGVSFWRANPHGKLYVHCHAGLNRSASMVYAILRVMGLKPKDARELIVANRPMDIVGVRYADEADSVIACL